MEARWSGYRAGRQRGSLSSRDCSGPWRGCSSIAVPLPFRTRAGGGRGGNGFPHQRHRIGVTAVVLPVEQHPGRTVDGRCAPRREGSPPCSSAGAPHAGQSEVRRGRRQLRRPVACCCACATARLARVGRQPAAILPARDGTAFRRSTAGRPQRDRPARRGIHLRRRASCPPLRDPEITARGCGGSRSPLAIHAVASSGTAASSTVTSLRPTARRRFTRGKWVLENVLGAPPPAPARRRDEPRAGRRAGEGNLAASAPGSCISRQSGVRVVSPPP